MQRFEVEIQGTSPLMHHRMPEDQLLGLLGTKTKIAKDKQERTPREIAEQYAYKTAAGNFYIPAEYLGGAFREAASDYKQSNKSRKSLKSIAAGIFRVETPVVELVDENGKTLKAFEVDIRKGTNHQKGAVAVCRPRFDRWGAKFTVVVNEELVDPSTANKVLVDAGARVGIGAFRIAKGGYHGQFIVTKWKQIKD